MAVPSDIGTLEFWLKSDTGVFKDAGVTPATVDGDAIQQWNDQSGNARHATQGTLGNRPLLETGLQINGINTVQFNSGSSHVMALPNFLTGFTAGEYFVIGERGSEPPSGSSTDGWMRLGSHASLNAHVPFSGDGRIYETFGSTSRHPDFGTGVLGPDALPGIPHHNDFSKPFIYNAWSASNDYGVLENGQLVYTSSTNTVGWTTAPVIGRSTAAGRHYSGRFAEMFLFSAKLSDSDRQDMFDYAVSRYALDATARWTQTAAMAVGNKPGNARFTQTAAMAVGGRPGDARFTASHLLMVRATTPARAFFTTTSVIVVRERIVVAGTLPRLKIIG